MIKNKLGNFVKIRTGKLDANASSIDGEYPFFTCSKQPLKISSFSYDCKCVLVAGNGDLNVKYYEGKFDAYQRTYIIESRDESILDTRYLYWFLFKYVEKLRELSIGGVIKYIKINNLTDPIIPIPPIEDQKRIVKILDEADAMHQKRKQAIILLDDYLKSVFLEMFGNPTNNPMRWDVKKIENITSSQKYSIRMGPFGSQLKKHELVNDGIKVIWIEDIVKNKFNWIEKNGKCITPDKYNQLKGFETKEDDILITNMGTIGRTAVVPKNFGKAIISSHLLKITPNTNLVNSIFLSEYIKSDFACNYFDKVAHGQIMKGLNTTKIKNLPIILPDIKLQNRFSDTFKKINEIKQTMIAQSKKLENQFQALMQKALKGEL